MSWDTGFSSARRPSSTPVRAGRWAPRATPLRQVAGVAGVAMLVLVVHSVHVHAAMGGHAETTDPPTASLLGGATPTHLGEFIAHAGALAGCMTLEFSAPRVHTLSLAGAGLLGLLIAVAATSQNSIAAGVELARPPPGTRRQALLGVFLS